MNQFFLRATITNVKRNQSLDTVEECLDNQTSCSYMKSKLDHELGLGLGSGP